MDNIRNIIFIDDETHQSLLPLTFTRPTGAIRVGILSIADKWSLRLNLPYSFYCKPYLQTKFPLKLSDDNIVIFGGLLPGQDIINNLNNLKTGQGIFSNGQLLICRVTRAQFNSVLLGKADFLEQILFEGKFESISHTYNIISKNKQEISNDFDLLTKGRVSEKLSSTVTIVGAETNPELRKKIFLEPGAKVEYVMLNPAEGPVYIGRDTLVMEGSIIRGPFAMCEHSQVNMGSKIYGGTTLGPWCKAGGELNNSIMQGYSNKAHDGFLGDSFIGEWCNLGADTNTSNLKNDFAEVKLWDYQTSRFLKTGMQFLGLIMGDYSRCGINTMFNSGTVVGVACNLFGPGFPRNFIPSFAMGGAHGFKNNTLNDVFRTIKIAQERRNLNFTDTDAQILKEVFEITKTFRTF